MYNDKLNDIMNKYNDAYHNTIKMKPVNVSPSMYIDLKIIRKIVNLKLVIMLDYQIIKLFLENFTFKISLTHFL